MTSNFPPMILMNLIKNKIKSGIMIGSFSKKACLHGQNVFLKQKI